MLSLGSSPNPSLLGQPVTFTVYISSGDKTQGGPITLTDTSTNTVLATLMPSTTTGFATFTTSTLTLGAHPITASYAGDATHNPATASLTQYIVNGNIATTTMLASSENPAALGDSVTFTATVTSASGTPTGSVKFAEGTTVYAIVPLNASGIAQWSSSTLAAGSHTITSTFVPIVFVPPSLYEESSASLIQTVNGLPTTTTLQIVQPSPTTGTPVQLIATVAPVTPIASPLPTGTVTFTQTFPPTSLALLLGTAPVGANGVASLTLSTLPIGTDNITCSYSGDSTFAGSVCTPGVVTINAPADFTLTGPSTITFLTTTSYGAPLTLASAGGFAANVALTCSAAIPQYVCVVTPSVSLPANGSAVATLSLQWVGLQQAERGGGVRAMMAAVLALGLLGLRRRRRWLGVLCLAGMVSAISACGSAAYPTVYGSYPVTVTAVGAGTVHSVTVTAQIVR
jgi:hypothetical protein